jgi:malate dehydrogenase (oxaloacetate-decarboxylating)(NADP+)
MMERKRRDQQIAKIEMRRRLTLIGSMLLHKGDVDGLIVRHLGHHPDSPELHRPGHRASAPA